MKLKVYSIPGFSFSNAVKVVIVAASDPLEAQILAEGHECDLSLNISAMRCLPGIRTSGKARVLLTQ